MGQFTLLVVPLSHVQVAELSSAEQVPPSGHPQLTVEQQFGDAVQDPPLPEPAMIERISARLKAFLMFRRFTFFICTFFRIWTNYIKSNLYTSRASNSSAVESLTK